MPRENRKRGKKHKVGHAEQTIYDTANVHSDLQEENHPSSQPAPLYGLLDPDVKAYFRTVDDQLREWQVEGISADVDADIDPNEGVYMDSNLDNNSTTCAFQSAVCSLQQLCPR